MNLSCVRKYKFFSICVVCGYPLLVTEISSQYVYMHTVYTQLNVVGILVLCSFAHMHTHAQRIELIGDTTQLAKITDSSIEKLKARSKGFSPVREACSVAIMSKHSFINTDCSRSELCVLMEN